MLCKEVPQLPGERVSGPHDHQTYQGCSLSSWDSPRDAADSPWEASPRGPLLCRAVWGVCKLLELLAVAAILAAHMISPALNLVDQAGRWSVLMALLKSHPVPKNCPKARTGLHPPILLGK